MTLQHSKFAPARSTAEKTARARQNPPKEKQAIFEQNEEFHVSTSQNPRFFCLGLYIFLHFI